MIGLGLDLKLLGGGASGGVPLFSDVLARYDLTLPENGTASIVINADGTESVGANLVTDSGFDAVTETNSYTSDFSVDTDGFISSNGVGTPNIDGIGGQDNNLRLVIDATDDIHYFLALSKFTVGNCYRVRADVYLDAGNSNMDGVWLSDGIAVFALEHGTVGSWITVDAYVNALGGTLYMGGSDGESLSFQDTGGDDIIYFRNVRIEAVTFTNWTAGTGWAPQATAGALTGKAQKVAGTASGLVKTSIVSGAGITLRNSANVTRSAGVLQVFNGAKAGAIITSTQVYLQDLLTVGVGNLNYYADASFVGTVDNVLLRQVTNPKQNGITCTISRATNRCTLSKTVAGTTTVLIDEAFVYSAGTNLIIVKDPNNKVNVFYNGARVGTEQTVSDASVIFQKRHYVEGDGTGTFLAKRYKLGAELVPNYALLRKADWTITGEDGTHITTDVATGIRYQSDTTSPVLQLSRAGALDVGVLYKIEVSLPTVTSGSVKISSGFSDFGLSDGLVHYAIAVGADLNIVRATADVDLIIGGLSLTKVNP